MKRIILLALCLVAGGNVRAEKREWNLEQCINYALENNISVRSSALQLEQKELDYDTAKGRVLPAVSASASENFSFGRGLTADNTYTNSNTSSTSFGLGAEVPVFQGLQLSNGIKMSRLDLEAATADLDKVKDDIRVAVAQAYVQILYDLQLRRVAQAQAEHDAQLLEQIVARKDAGKASSADVSAQKATLANSRLSLTQAESNLRLSTLALTQLLELPSPDDFSVVEPSEEALVPGMLCDPEEIYLRALGIRPVIRSAELQLERSRIGIDQAKGAYLPSLSLNGGIGTNYYTTSNVTMPSFGEQLKRNFSQYIGLSLNIPIFSRFSTRNGVRSARLSYENSQLSLESARKDLYKEIQQAYCNAVNAGEKLLSSEESAISSREHYELVEQKYLAGKAGISDYNDAKNSRLQAECELLKARYEAYFQARLLAFYGGETLSSAR